MANDTELVLVPLGGFGEIGMNVCLYGIGPEAKRRWLLIDLGIAFAGEGAPGVDVIMPDLRFVEGIKKNLDGIVITHAHEDHFGALAEMWPRIGGPVHLTPFAAGLLEARRLSEPGAPKIPLRLVEQGARVKIGAFDVEFIPVAHSVPESCALAIRTEAGLVFHTGDWKIDPTPVVGLPTNEARIAQLGDEGVLAMIGDSTNVLRTGASPSEAEVARTLKELIAEAPARVAVTTFASNVARMRAVAEAAAACGREVMVVGRAMDRVVQVAAERGFLDGLPAIRGSDAFRSTPRERTVLLLTGSQGEDRAAMARVALDEHPAVSLAPGDRVIFSSRTIPGNEKPVGAVINGLVRRGIEVITDRTHLVHVSGHPRVAEVERMYGWVRPRIAIPAHGEPIHLTEHAALARRLGVPEVVRAFNGEVVRLAPGEAKVIGDVPSGRLLKDGRLLVPETDRSIMDRRRLAIAGSVVIALAVDERGDLAADPDYTLDGLPPKGADGTPMLTVVSDVVEAVCADLPAGRRRDPDALRNAVERAVRSAVSRAWDKKPMVRVMVLPV